MRQFQRKPRTISQTYDLLRLFVNKVLANPLQQVSRLLPGKFDRCGILT
jgi:hypothetical protein